MADHRRAQRVPAADGAEADAAGGGETHGVGLRSVLTSAGALWGRTAQLGARDLRAAIPHEVYGQTECNARGRRQLCGVDASAAGIVGRAVPRHSRPHPERAGGNCADGETRHYRGARADPRHDRYWKNPRSYRREDHGRRMSCSPATRRPRMRTAMCSFRQPEDDVITSPGYRVGPSEIEHTLLKHPAVALSAVVGIPDPIRTKSIKAWIVLRPGFAPSDALARDPGFRQGAARRA